jgi:hypothetical protein
VKTTRCRAGGFFCETKGREWEDTDAKAEHMARWCREVSALTGHAWRYLKVPQGRFALFLKQGSDSRSFHALVSALGCPVVAEAGLLRG